jgi:hypothetical protein
MMGSSQWLEGTFYKTGAVIKGFRERRYKLEWLGKRLYYGDSGESFDLAKVTDLKVKVERLDIDHQKNYVAFLSRKTLPVQGVITLEFEATAKPVGGASLRRLALTDLEEFNTFAYWLMASVERWSIVRFITKHEDVRQLGAAARGAYFSRRVAHIFEEAYKDVSLTASTETMDDLLARKHLGEVKSVLGFGGSGTELLGLAPTADTKPAPNDVPLGVKVGYDKRAVADLLHEAKAMACAHRLGRHPNILSLHGFEVFAGGVLMAFERLPVSAWSWLDTHVNGTPAPTAIRKMVHGVLSGYARLHEARVYHLDQKPANLMFRSNGEPVIIDFGIARSVHFDTEDLWSPIADGTTTWTEPQQWSKPPKDSRTLELIDSFKVGLLLLRLLFDGRVTEPSRPIEELGLREDEPLMAPRVAALTAACEMPSLPPELRALARPLLPLLELDRAKRSTVRELWRDGSPLREMLKVPTWLTVRRPNVREASHPAGPRDGTRDQTGR